MPQLWHDKSQLQWLSSKGKAKRSLTVPALNAELLSSSFILLPCNKAGKKNINHLNVNHFYWYVSYFAFLVAWSRCAGRLTKPLMHLYDVVCQHCSLRLWSCHIHCLSCCPIKTTAGLVQCQRLNWAKMWLFQQSVKTCLWTSITTIPCLLGQCKA